MKKIITYTVEQVAQLNMLLNAVSVTGIQNAMPFTKRKRKGKYFEEPIRVTPKTEEEKKMEEDLALQRFLGFAGAFEKDVKRRDGKGE